MLSLELVIWRPRLVSALRNSGSMLRSRIPFTSIGFPPGHFVMRAQKHLDPSVACTLRSEPLRLAFTHGLYFVTLNMQRPGMDSIALPASGLAQATRMLRVCTIVCAVLDRTCVTTSAHNTTGHLVYGYVV